MKLLKLDGLIFALILLLVGLNSQAAVFQIKNRQYGNLDTNSFPTVQAEIDNAFNLMEEQVNSQLSAFDASNYLQGVANSTALASNGITHDNASRFNYFLFAIGGGLAADIGDSTPSADSNLNSFSGLSGTYQMTFGFRGTTFRIPKFWIIDPQRLKIYFGMASQTFSQDQLTLDFSSYSLMFQYRFFQEYSFFWRLFRWGGVHLTTGVKSTKLKILYTENFSKSQTQTLSSPGNPVLNMQYNATAQLGAETAAATIPIDVSSSIGYLFIYDLYAGFGADINTGTTKSIISAPGTVTANESSNTLGTMSGDIEFDLGDKAQSQPFVTRTFVGTALDFRVFSVGFQFTKATSNSAQAISINLAAHF